MPVSSPSIVKKRGCFFNNPWFYYKIFQKSNATRLYDVSIPDLIAKEEESVCKPETMNLVAVVVLVVKYL